MPLDFYGKGAGRAGSNIRMSPRSFSAGSPLGAVPSQAQAMRSSVTPVSRKENSVTQSVGDSGLVNSQFFSGARRRGIKDSEFNFSDQPSLKSQFTYNKENGIFERKGQETPGKEARGDIEDFLDVSGGGSKAYDPFSSNLIGSSLDASTRGMPGDPLTNSNRTDSFQIEPPDEDLLSDMEDLSFNTIGQSMDQDLEDSRMDFEKSMGMDPVNDFNPGIN